MNHGTSTQKTSRRVPRRTALICILLIAAAGIAFVWLMIEPTYIVSGTVRIIPVIRTLDGPAPTDSSEHEQFVNTQAVLLMNDEEQLQRIAGELGERNLSFFTGEPTNTMQRLVAKVFPRDRSVSRKHILKKAIANGIISAGYVPDTELMAVTMKSTNVEEAQVIVNSFLRNYVNQYGQTVTAREHQSIATMERQRDEMEKRICKLRAEIQEREDGTASLHPGREMEESRRRAMQDELARLEMTRIKTEADIAAYEKAEKLDIAPEQLVQARTTFINTDPMMMELSARIVQIELDLTVAGQDQPPTDPAVPAKETVLKALRERFQERRLALVKEFDDSLENMLKEAAHRRVAQAKIEKARIEAYTQGIGRALGTQEIKVVNTGASIQEMESRLAKDEETLDEVNRRLKWLQMEQDRRPRVQIASPATVKDIVDSRWRWTIIVLAAATVLSTIELISKRPVRQPATDNVA